MLWIAWLAVDVGRVAFGDGAAQDRRLDAREQVLQSDPAVAREPVHARLQVALLQMAADGPQTAVLCATSLPLSRGALRQVSCNSDWRAPVSWMQAYVDQVWYDEISLKSGEFRALSWNTNEAFGDLQRNLSVQLRWLGQREGRDCLQVESSSMHSKDSRWGQSTLKGWLPSLALVSNQPYFVWLPGSGSVMALCVEDAAAPAAPWTTRADWRQAVMASVGGTVPAGELVAEPDDPIDGFVQLSAERSRAVASVVFLDRQLAPGYEVDAAADLLAVAPRTAGDRPGSFLDGYVLALRSLCLHTSGERLRTAAAALPHIAAETLLAFADVPVPAAAATAWAQVMQEARERSWPRWQHGLPMPLRLAVLLAPLLLLLWLCLRWRGDVQGPIRLGGAALLLVLLLEVQTPSPGLMVAQQFVLLVVVLLMAVRRLGPATPRIDRVLLALAFTGMWLLLLWCAGLDALLRGTVLEPLVDGGMATWIVLGTWVLRDGRWRWPQLFACALVVAVLGVFSWAFLEHSAPYLTILLLAACTHFCCLLLFLLGGHRRAPAPAMTPAMTPAPV